MDELARVVMHACAIEECTTEIPLRQVMCHTHWRLVPRPIQHDVYAMARTRRGTAAHHQALARAKAAVRKTLAGREAQRATYLNEHPGYLPYRDD